MKEITQELVKKLFDYKDGILYWKKPPHPKIKLGDKAGSFNDRYYHVKINYENYLTHRIIYLFHYGYLPKEIDHIDQNKLNNNIENLREVTQSQNNMNRKKCKNCSSKYKGVCWHKRDNCWQVSIGFNNKRLYLGSFTNEIDAAIAYNNKAIELFGEFVYLNRI